MLATRESLDGTPASITAQECTGTARMESSIRVVSSTTSAPGSPEFVTKLVGFRNIINLLAHVITEQFTCYGVMGAVGLQSIAYCVLRSGLSNSRLLRLNSLFPDSARTKL